MNSRTLIMSLSNYINLFKLFCIFSSDILEEKSVAQIIYIIFNASDMMIIGYMQPSIAPTVKQTHWSVVTVSDFAPSWHEKFSFSGQVSNNTYAMAG